MFAAAAAAAAVAAADGTDAAGSHDISFDCFGGTGSLTWSGCTIVVTRQLACRRSGKGNLPPFDGPAFPHPLVKRGLANVQELTRRSDAGE